MGDGQRRKQPERYAKYGLNWLKNIGIKNCWKILDNKSAVKLQEPARGNTHPQND
jgi:hypothetical protein